jgi:hypothetical protein
MMGIICGLVLVSSGAGAFDMVTAQRQSSISVSGPSNAFFEISTTEPTVSGPNQTADTQRKNTNEKVGTQRTNSKQTPRTRKKKIVLGTVTNRFASDLTSFEITVSGGTPGGVAVRDVSVATVPLASSSSSDLMATVECTSAGRTTETVTLDIKARGPGVRFSTTQDVKVTCPGLPSRGTNTATKASPNKPKSLTVLP